MQLLLCPLIRVLGLQCLRKTGQSIRDALDATKGRDICRRLGEEAVDLLQDYLRNSYRVIAILGSNEQSPGCAIHMSGKHDDPLQINEISGILIQQLTAVLSEHGTSIPFLSMRDTDRKNLDEDLCRFKIYLQKAAMESGPPQGTSDQFWAE